MAAHRSTGKRSSRSSDTRSPWAGVTVRRTVSGRGDEPPTSSDNTRTRAKQTAFPPIRQAGSGCSSAGRRSTTSHLGRAKAYTEFEFLVRLPRARGTSSTRATCVRCATTPWTCTRAPSDYIVQVISGSTRANLPPEPLRDRAWPCRSGRLCSGAGCGLSPCVRQPARARRRGRCGACRRAPRHGPAAAAAAGCARSGPRRARHHGLTDQAGLRCVHARTVRRAAQDRVRDALAADLGSPESRAPGPQGGTPPGRRTSATCQVDRHAPPSAASRSSQERSHRRHSSADRRQCSW